MNRLEDQMRDKLRDLNTPPPKYVWQNIEQELHPNGIQRNVFGEKTRRFMAVAAAATLLTGGAWLAWTATNGSATSSPSVVTAPVVAPIPKTSAPKEQSAPATVEQSVVSLPTLPTWKKTGAPKPTNTPKPTMLTPTSIAPQQEMAVQQIPTPKPDETTTVKRTKWSPVQPLSAPIDAYAIQIQVPQRKVPRIFRADLRNPIMLAQNNNDLNARGWLALIVQDVRKADDGETSISERVFNSAVTHGTELVKQIDLQTVAAELRDRLDGDDY